MWKNTQTVGRCFYRKWSCWQADEARTRQFKGKWSACHVKRKKMFHPSKV